MILSAGTSYHAAVAARYAIEEWARVPVEHDIASEWIYRNPVLDASTLVIGISQSGETRDTIAGMKLAREMGARTVAITNMMGSQITREVDSVLYTRAGLEVSVAASKTFTAQVSLLFLLALKLAQVRETLPLDEFTFILDEVYLLPEKIQAFLDGDHPIDEIAQRHFDKPFFLYLGRHIGLPVALEGALKLKEISYIPTEAYSAGEMKHGPIALLDESTPVVVMATRSHVYDKMVSNIQEVRARGAHVIAIATDGNEDIQHHADDVIYIPRAPAFLSDRARRRAAAVARLQDRASARPQRRPAAQSRQDRHGRITGLNRGVVGARRRSHQLPQRSGGLVASHRDREHACEGAADERPDDVDPEVPELAGPDRRIDRARRVERAARRRADRHGRDEDEAADRHGGEDALPRRRVVGRDGDDHRDEEEHGDELHQHRPPVLDAGAGVRHERVLDVVRVEQARRRARR